MTSSKCVICKTNEQGIRYPMCDECLGKAKEKQGIFVE